MSSYKEAMFLAEFKSFLDERVDCRLENLQTEDNRTASHEDRTGELESKVEELESKVVELESELSYQEDRIGELEVRVSDTWKFEAIENTTALIDSRIKHLVLAGDLHLSLTTRHES